MAMPEPATGMTPLEYMTCADQELAAGHHRKAAALLWKATEATFLGLARERGLDLDKLKKAYMSKIAPVWKRRLESWPDPIDYSDQADPAWNLDLSLNFGDFIPLAKALGTDPSVRKLDYKGYLTAASLLRDHALMDVLEDYELESAYDDAREFIAECIGEPQ